jgi:hypothetical protein
MEYWNARILDFSQLDLLIDSVIVTKLTQARMILELLIEILASNSIGQIPLHSLPAIILCNIDSIIALLLPPINFGYLAPLLIQSFANLYLFVCSVL